MTCVVIHSEFILVTISKVQLVQPAVCVSRYTFFGMIFYRTAIVVRSEPRTPEEEVEAKDEVLFY